MRHGTYDLLFIWAHTLIISNFFADIKNMRHVIVTLSAILLIFPFFSFSAKTAEAGQQYILSGIVYSMKSGGALTEEVGIEIDGKKSKFKSSLSGEYRAYLEPGKHILTFSHDRFRPATLEIELGEIINHKYMIYRNIGLEPIEKSVKISGTVREVMNGGTVPYAKIIVNREAYFADEAGYFELEAYPGTQSVRITSKGYFPLKKVFALASGEIMRFDPLLLRCTFYGRIRGKVAEKTTREPIAGAIVEIAGERVYTDIDGSFEMEHPASAMTEITCTMQGYAKIREKVKLVAGDNTLKIYMKNKDRSSLTGKKK